MPAPSLGLDHIVVLVRDLNAAAKDYERLGFTVAPEMRHAGFGTANRIVLLQNNFIELVGVVAPDELAGPGIMIRDRLESHGPGPFGISLNSEDIVRDRARLIEAGLAMGEIGGGSRPVPLPDGTEGMARFNTVMIGGPREMPFIFFMSQQHEQSVVWIKEWQRHANTARDVTGVTIATANPSAWLPLVTALCGSKGVEADADGISARLPLGVLDIVTEDAATRTFASPATGEASRIVAVSLAAAKPIARIPAASACGLILDFETA